MVDYPTNTGTEEDRWEQHPTGGRPYATYGRYGGEEGARKLGMAGEAYGRFGESRDAQNQALGYYENAIRGSAPSVARQQLLKGQKSAMAANLAAIGQTRGGNLGAIGSQAGAASAANMAETSQQAAMLRANEVSQARQGYAGQANMMSQQDMQQQLAYEQLLQQQYGQQMGAEMQWRLGNRALREQEKMGRFQRIAGGIAIGSSAIGSIGSAIGSFGSSVDAKTGLIGTGTYNTGEIPVNARYRMDEDPRRAGVLAALDDYNSGASRGYEGPRAVAWPDEAEGLALPEHAQPMMRGGAGRGIGIPSEAKMMAQSNGQHMMRGVSTTGQDSELVGTMHEGVGQGPEAQPQSPYDENGYIREDSDISGVGYKPTPAKRFDLANPSERPLVDQEGAVEGGGKGGGDLTSVTDVAGNFSEEMRNQVQPILDTGDSSALYRYLPETSYSMYYDKPEIDITSGKKAKREIRDAGYNEGYEQGYYRGKTSGQDEIIESERLRRAPQRPQQDSRYLEPQVNPLGYQPPTRSRTAGVREGSTVREAVDALEPVSFEYRSGYGPEGRRHGFLAEDLQRTQEGANIVHGEGADKKVETGGAASLALAWAADAEDRLKSIEGALGISQDVPSQSNQSIRSGYESKEYIQSGKESKERIRTLREALALQGRELVETRRDLMKQRDVIDPEQRRGSIRRFAPQTMPAERERVSPRLRRGLREMDRPVSPDTFVGPPPLDRYLEQPAPRTVPPVRRGRS